MPFSIRPHRRFPLTYNAGSPLKLPLAYFSGFWLLITLIMLSSGPAYAEWVALGDSDSETTVYVDPPVTIRPRGDLVKMWHLYDHKTVPKKAPEPYLSSRGQDEFDCADERTRKLSETYFSGNMGRGEQVYSNSDETRWEPVAPGSVGQVMWKVACDKK